MLLSTEEVKSAEDACRIIGYYKQRWQIEEWHRCLKQGCAVEEVQLKSATALSNLISMLSIVAVRLLQLRNMSRCERSQNLPACDFFPETWLKACAVLSKRPMGKMSVKDFWTRLAKLGGWLGRKNDPPAGWLAIWSGWQDVALVAQGIECARNFCVEG
jgi:hypothetical protein